MGFEADLLLDRARLKRRLVAWRAVAALAVISAAFVAWHPAPTIGLGRHLARLRVDGVITENDRLVQAINAAADDPAVAALIVSIDSPGGSVAGGEMLHDAVARVAARKPVVAIMGGTAASAGYMIAVPAARIFAREGTLTGSIGVLLQTGEVSALLSRLGITTDAIVSGPLKDQPSFTKPLTPAGQQYLQGLVMDLYDQFVEMVASGRHMEASRVRALADGRAYTGRQALALGLVDQIGGEADARQWLAQARGVSAALPVRDLVARNWRQSLFGADLANGLLGLVESVFAQRVTLDGAWSLWQPQASLGR